MAGGQPEAAVAVEQTAASARAREAAGASAVVGSKSATEGGAAQAPTGKARQGQAATEGEAAHAARVVAVPAARSAEHPRVAAAAEGAAQGQEARAEGEAQGARARAQAQEGRAQGTKEGAQAGQEAAPKREARAQETQEEEQEALRTRHHPGADAGPVAQAVAARAQVGHSVAQEGGAAAADAVGARVLVDGGNERAFQRLAGGLEAVPKARSLTAGSYLSYESEDDNGRKMPAFLEEEEVDDPEMGKIIVPKIRTFTLDSDSSSQLGRYINEELHPEMTTMDPHSLHAMRGGASPCSSTHGSESHAIPHSKSLELDDIPPSTVFQAVPSSNIEVVEVVAEQSWLITKLTVQLLWALRMSQRWILCTLRLILFVVLMMPPLLKVAVNWAWNPCIHKNIIYGMNARNLLDVYVPPKTASDAKKEDGTEPAPRYPVIVFISGGAWIIGYKAWGALMGRALSCFGVVVVMPDYRNFPQGILPDMVDDATRALQWVFDNVHHFGGDRENVTLIGQSAGAHISLCALLEQVERKEQVINPGHRSRSNSMSSYGATLDQNAFSRTFSTSSNLSTASCESVESAFTRPPTWELKQIRSYIGISGPYNMEASLATFHRHGFDKGVVERIMAHKLAYYSPSLRLLAKSELRSYTHALDDFPPAYLFHGTADKTVNWQSTEQLASAFRACKIPVKSRLFEGKSHTDPIIEDPIVGDDFLLDEIVKIMKERSPIDKRTGRPVYELGELTPEKRYYPAILVRLARWVNPF